jgi:hypothetical protein
MLGGGSGVTDRDQLHAFYAVIGAVCYLTTLAVLLAYLGKMTEAVGVGAAVTGLLALARSPARAGVNVEQASQVGPNGPASAPPSA